MNVRWIRQLRLLAARGGYRLASEDFSQISGAPATTLSATQVNPAWCQLSGDAKALVCARKGEQG